MSELALIQLAVCWFMTGVIWLVQVLVYPSFYDVPAGEFSVFHTNHTQRISWIVAPAMMIELLTAAGLVYLEPNTFWILNFVGVLSIWGVTFLISVPRHHQLSAQKDSGTIQSLIHSNWIRTALWSARALGLSLFIST